MPTDAPTGLAALDTLGDQLLAEVQASTNAPIPISRKKPNKRALAVMAYRMEGLDNREIAEKLGITTQTVRDILKKLAVRFGWNHLTETITDVAVPKAVSNVIKHLEHEGSPAGVFRGDNTMTLATMRGTGLYRSHSAVKQESKSEKTNVMRVEIVLPTLPPGSTPPALAEGSVLASPRRALVTSEPLALPAAPQPLEGEIVDAPIS